MAFWLLGKFVLSRFNDVYGYMTQAAERKSQTTLENENIKMSGCCDFLIILHRFVAISINNKSLPCAAPKSSQHCLTIYFSGPIWPQFIAIFTWIEWTEQGTGACRQERQQASWDRHGSGRIGAELNGANLRLGCTVEKIAKELL